MGDHVYPGEFPRAQGKHVVDHIADHDGSDEAWRIGARRKEIAPTDRARPDGEQAQSRCRRHPAPLRAVQLLGESAEINGREQIDEQGDADRAADEDLEALQRPSSSARRFIPGRPPPG